MVNVSSEVEVPSPSAITATNNNQVVTVNFNVNGHEEDDDEDHERRKNAFVVVLLQIAVLCVTIVALKHLATMSAESQLDFEAKYVSKSLWITLVSLSLALQFITIVIESVNSYHFSKRKPLPLIARILHSIVGLKFLILAAFMSYLSEYFRCSMAILFASLHFMSFYPDIAAILLLLFTIFGLGLVQCSICTIDCVSCLCSGKK